MTTAPRTCRFSLEENRVRILDKADELFRQYGFGKTTVADIAGELGMSPANIYKSFPSKDAIVKASAKRNISRIRESITALASVRNKTVPRRIEAIALLLFRFHQDLFRNERQIFKMVIQAVEESWECIDEFNDFLLATLESLLKEGIASGELHAVNVGVTARALLDALFLALHPHFRHSWTPEETPGRVRAHLDLVLSALRRPSFS